jgi:hypothetical protein
VTTTLNPQRKTARRGRRWPIALTFAAMLALGAFAAPARLAAQDNVFDLRVMELNSKGDLTYQNFIYAHMFDAQKWMVQVLYLRLASDSYSEYAGGVGYRVASVGGFSGYGIAGYGSSNAGNYFEPAFFVNGSQGKWSGSFYLQRYVAVDTKGTNAWLIDPIEAAYNFAGPFTAGLSAYVYHPDLGGSVNKLGVKVGVNDKLGTTEVRISNVTTTGQSSTAEFQLRRVIVF